jgi:hypothetical protein
VPPEAAAESVGLILDVGAQPPRGAGGLAPDPRVEIPLRAKLNEPPATRNGELKAGTWMKSERIRGENLCW